VSSVCLSVTFCIVAKRYVLSKNCLKEWIGNRGEKVDFLGRRHISTSGFVRSATASFSWVSCYGRVAARRAALSIWPQSSIEDRFFSSCFSVQDGMNNGGLAYTETATEIFGIVLHMAQLMPLPLNISCFRKSRLVLPSWFYLSGTGSPG